MINPSSIPTRPLPETISPRAQRITEPLGNPNTPNNEHGIEPLKITIPLVKGKDYIGKDAYVSPIDADLADTQKNHQWHLNKHGYAVYQRRVEKRRYTAFLHREIAKRIAKRTLTTNDVVEHIDGNRLNNERNNINIISRSEKSQKYKESKSGIKGVHYHQKIRNKWEATIKINSRRKSLGYYATPEEAGEAIERYKEQNARNKLSDNLKSTIADLSQEEQQ